MSKIVQLTLNSAATSALVLDNTQVRLSPYSKGRLPSIVFRKKTKGAESLYGYGTAFSLEDGKAVIRTPLAQYLQRMEDIEPPQGSFLMKDITGGRYMIANGIPLTKEGKRVLVNGEFRMDIEIVEVGEEAAPVVEQVAPAEIETPAMEEQAILGEGMDAPVA